MKAPTIPMILRALALRLLAAVCLVSVFLFLIAYASRFVTYEYGEKTQSDSNVKGSDTIANKDVELRILRISDDNSQYIGIFRPDGTLVGHAPFPVSALTEYDMDLLRSGISVSASELSVLLEETEAAIPY